MRTDTLAALVLELTAETTRRDPAELDLTTPLHELGLDSLGIVTLAALVESATGLHLENEAGTRLLEAQTIADLVACFETTGPDEA